MPTPTNPSVLPIPGGLRVGWLGGSGSYTVRTSPTGAGTWTEHGPYSGNAAEITGLSYATTYDVQVTGDAGGAWTASVTGQPYIDTATGSTDIPVVIRRLGVAGVLDLGNLGSGVEASDHAICCRFRRTRAGAQDALIHYQGQSSAATDRCGPILRIDTGGEIDYLVPVAGTYTTASTATTFGVGPGKVIANKSGTALTLYTTDGASANGSATASGSTTDFSTTSSKRTIIGGVWDSNTSAILQRSYATADEIFVASRALTQAERVAVLRYFDGVYEATPAEHREDFLDTAFRDSGTLSPTVPAATKYPGNPVYTDPDGLSLRYFDVQKVGTGDWRGITPARGAHDGSAYTAPNCGLELRSTDGINWTKGVDAQFAVATGANITTPSNVIYGASGDPTYPDIYLFERYDDAGNATAQIYKRGASGFVLVKDLVVAGALIGADEAKFLVRDDDGRWWVYYVRGQSTDRRTVRRAGTEGTDPAGNWLDFGDIAAWTATTNTAQYYTLGVQRWGSLWVATVSDYDETTEQMGLDLYASRDLASWSLVKADWLPVGTGGDFDRGFLWPGYGMWQEDGDEIRYYHYASTEVHSTPLNNTGLCLATMPAGRAGGITGTGTWVSDPFRTLAGSRLMLNADPGGGTVTVALLDATSGDPLPGFGHEDCDPITASYGSEVTWGGKSLPPHRDVKVGLDLASAAGAYSFELLDSGGNGGIADAEPADPVSAGAASKVAGGTTSIGLSATDATGGTGPYSYQWQRGTTSSGPWSDESGKTSLSATITGLSASTTYHFRLRYTDAAAGVAYSNVVTAATDDAPGEAGPRRPRYFPGLFGRY